MGGVVQDVRACVPSADVLVVDDGSSDATRREAQQAGSARSVTAGQLGYGAALQAGYKYAVRTATT